MSGEGWGPEVAAARATVAIDSPRMPAVEDITGPICSAVASLENLQELAEALAYIGNDSAERRRFVELVEGVASTLVGFVGEALHSDDRHRAEALRGLVVALTRADEVVLGYRADRGHAAVDAYRARVESESAA